MVFSEIDMVARRYQGAARKHYTPVAATSPARFHNLEAARSPPKIL
jgi:hypothetical protein